MAQKLTETNYLHLFVKPEKKKQIKSITSNKAKIFIKKVLDKKEGKEASYFDVLKTIYPSLQNKESAKSILDEINKFSFDSLLEVKKILNSYEQFKEVRLMKLLEKEVKDNQNNDEDVKSYYEKYIKNKED